MKTIIIDGIEYNLTPKARFKKGDWIVFNDQPEKGSIYQVEKICNYQYTLRHILGASIPFSFSKETMLRHWAIEDAKNGDVLARNNDILSICIFSHFDGINNKYSSFLCHCGLEGEGLGQELSINGYHDDSKDYVPATKEQRNILFAKMKEAGYEWDADKKELKIIDNRFDYEHANIQQKDFAPKATTANRQIYNQAILKILSNYVEKYPDVRFGQMLCNLDVKPHFDQESRETFWNLSKTINKQNHE